MVAVQRGTLRDAFLNGLLTGVIYFTGTLYWITNVMATYGDIGTGVAMLINALLIAYLALFPALFALIVRRVAMVIGPRSLILAPFVWVATELGRMHIMTGFPWVLLGYSQVTFLPIAQFASLLGVFGLSGLVATVSAALAWAAVRGQLDARAPRARQGSPVAAYVPLFVVLAVVVAIGGWGAVRVSRGDLTRQGEPVTVGLIQGNVDQAEKWDPARAQSIFREYLDMTRNAIGRGAQMVLWPESSTPFFFEEDRPGAELVRAIAREARVPILLGSDQIDRTSTPAKYYNAACMVRPDGSTGGVYRKVHLVPFGEYVPLKNVLFFVDRLVQNVSDFSAGDAAVLLPARGHLLTTAICYEIVYPDLVRRGAATSELITTITNDAWFGRTSAPYQHFAQASMRAIENGRYLVRAANTGISGIVDPYGHVLAETDIFEPAVVVGEARFLRVRTIYARIGDVFANASAVITLAALLLLRRRVE